MQVRSWCLCWLNLLITGFSLVPRVYSFTCNNIGAFLYYERAVGCTMLAARGTIATQQAKPTSNTMKKVTKFLDYVASHDDAIITYKGSDIVLAVNSNASYLSENKARSQVGGNFYMSPVFVSLPLKCWFIYFSLVSLSTGISPVLFSFKLLFLIYGVYHY